MCAAVDPEGRFIVVIGMEDSTLFQLELVDDPSPMILYTTAEIPDLIKIGSIGRGLHSSGPRALILSSPGNPNYWASAIRIALYDNENDEIFESNAVFSDAQWQAGTFGSWVDNFRDY